MGSLVEEIPKPLLPIGGRAVLGHQIDLLLAAGIADITVLTGFRADEVEARLAPQTPAGAHLIFVAEPWPSGSGGCLLHAGFGDHTLVVLFGDVMVDMDLAELLRFHRLKGGDATAVVHPNDHPEDSDLVQLEAGQRIATVHRKPHPPGLTVRNLVTAGVFVLEPAMVRRIPAERKVDLVHDVLAPAVEQGAEVFAYATAEYLKDMGTPRRYAAVDRDWRRGRVAALRRSNPRPAAFLDRDGTLNRHVGYISDPAQIELLPGVAEAVRELNQAGVWTLVITNQPVVARGECDEADLEIIHGRLEMELGRGGAYLDAIYYCPHHPDSGFSGERPSYKRKCACRKPGIGLIEQALNQHAVDLENSAFFGDTWRDMEAARRLACQPFLVGEKTTADAELPPGCRVVEGLLPAVRQWLAGQRGGELPWALTDA